MLKYKKLTDLCFIRFDTAILNFILIHNAKTNFSYLKARWNCNIILSKIWIFTLKHKISKENTKNRSTWFRTDTFNVKVCSVPSVKFCVGLKMAFLKWLSINFCVPRTCSHGSVSQARTHCHPRNPSRWSAKLQIIFEDQKFMNLCFEVLR